MKTFKIVLGIVFISVLIWSCNNETKTQYNISEVEIANSNTEITNDAPVAKAEFTIEGMTCAMGCAKRIEKKLSEMDGVRSATVNFDKKLAMVEYEEGKVTTSSFEKIVTDAGEDYVVTEMKTVESFTANAAKDGNHKACKKGDKAHCSRKGDKAQANAGGENKVCDKDCKKACCASKA